MPFHSKAERDRRKGIVPGVKKKRKKTKKRKAKKKKK